MVERMLQEVPDMMREVFRGKLMGIANQKAAGGPIAEEHVLAIVKEIVPDPFKTAILKAFATMGGVDLSNLEQLIKTTAGGQETVIGLLHAVQAEFGYCPREAIVMISQRKTVPLATMYRLLTCYSAFRLQKPGKHIIIAPDRIEEYIALGGYQALAKALGGMKPAQGSAGIKWEACSKAAGDKKYIVCNGSEGDPEIGLHKSFLSPIRTC